MAEVFIFLGVFVTAIFAGGGLPKIISAVSDHQNRKVIAQENSTAKVVELMDQRLTASESRISILESIVTESHGYISELIAELHKNNIKVPERKQRPKTHEQTEFTD